MTAFGDSCAVQGSNLVRYSAIIMHTNLQVYQKVLGIHNFVTSLPPQLRQDQPVYFVDAYGKETVFYLDFVCSSKVLIDWLMRRFETTGQGKVARGEFVLSDSRTKRELNLSEPWDALFYPGMHVEMDMVFQDVCAPTDVNSCPACHSVNADQNEGRIKWDSLIIPGKQLIHILTISASNVTCSFTALPRES
ncbi:hypothetical protein EAF04_003078 [Stromatinia cepivora]|nr:hypothetical protein EAF04_003078 [Stromatinia cepivora]